jgi:hypothetical protein
MVWGDTWRSTAKYRRNASSSASALGCMARWPVDTPLLLLRCLYLVHEMPPPVVQLLPLPLGSRLSTDDCPLADLLEKYRAVSVGKAHKAGPRK